MHVGREPKSPVFNYPRDPYLICSAKAVEEVIRAYPKLRVCVPHMGADEYTDYRRLIEQYDNLWLDNAMILRGLLSRTGRPRSFRNALQPDNVRNGLPSLALCMGPRKLKTAL